jgi:pimeloyl-ACP methyl ester carboxylesterase
VVLLHGYGLDAMGNYGPFDYSMPAIAKNLARFKEEFGVAPPMPDPPAEGRPGLIRRLLDEGARVVAPDLRGFGASGKPRDPRAYADSAMARDVVALIGHLGLDAADVVGFSMGALTGAKFARAERPARALGGPRGISEFILDGAVLEFPRSFPIPDNLPRPLTNRVWAEEGARILEGGVVVKGHLASAHVVMAEATGLDPRALAAVMRGAIAEGVAAAALKRSTAPVLLPERQVRRGQPEGRRAPRRDARRHDGIVRRRSLFHAIPADVPGRGGVVPERAVAPVQGHSPLTRRLNPTPDLRRLGR